MKELEFVPIPGLEIYKKEVDIMVGKDKERIAITIQKDTLERIKELQNNFPIKLTLSETIELIIQLYYEKKKEQS